MDGFQVADDKFDHDTLEGLTDDSKLRIMKQFESTLFGDPDDEEVYSPTTQSNSEPSTTPMAATHLPLSMADDTTAFLDGLERFIPVGVLYRGNNIIRGHLEDEATQYPAAEVRKLESHGWIRTSVMKNECPGMTTVRVYSLPDDTGHKKIPRTNVALRRSLKMVMSRLDTSSEAWERCGDPFTIRNTEQEVEGESLFYIYNTLESPMPNLAAVRDQWARTAMKDLLWKGGLWEEQNSEYEDKSGVVGLRTPLYAYQRRSAALMVQKEVEPGESLDPRLQCFQGPTGQMYYYDKEEGVIVREKRLYSNASGGVLAETMGSGKTLICLAVIIATRGHLPRIPADHIPFTFRKRTGSLMEMAAAAAGRFSIPWKKHFDELQEEGMYYSSCVKACESQRGAYIQHTQCRSVRGKVTSTHIRLCSGTLVVVPANLFDHWLREISMHTQGLKVLPLRDGTVATPPADKLLEYDIVLFSKPRFNKEAAMITAQNTPYGTPLRQLHWLRIIVDEGHNFSSTGQKTSAVHLLERLQVERRWVVSGTPSNGLYGMEVALASQETTGETLISEKEKASKILSGRKSIEKTLNEELRNLDKLRRIVVDFLGIKPWSNSRLNDPANWGKYVKPVGNDGRKMTPALRPLLQSVFVRHRAEDINKELSLPKLHNKVVYLEPTYYDRLSLNLFIFQLAINAITSERTDEDYMFHPKNRKHLSLLISNLRHAGFWWTGFKREDVVQSLNVAMKYKEKNYVWHADRELLDKAIDIGTKILNCRSWNALSRYDDLGVFIHDFPAHARNFWGIDDLNEHQQPLLTGIVQANKAQQYVKSHLNTCDPAEGLAGAGIKAKKQREDVFRPVKERVSKGDKPKDYVAPRASSDLTPKKETSTSTSTKIKSLLRESPLARAKTVATTSAKLTYLMERVLELHESEKIIIFYEHDNIAFWVSEALEILGVTFRIYAKSLKMEQKVKWLSMFNNTEHVRVLLMDIKQASHGLHLSSASRVFIVNPIWDPNTESQAIKRAHRISQTKPVFVETLVLKDTLEDKMLRRRKAMSNAELQHAERDLLDDQTMSYIIQTQDFLAITEDEVSAIPAYLKNPPGFFDRHTLRVPDNDAIVRSESPTSLPFPIPPFRVSAQPLSPSPSPLKEKKRKALDEDDTTDTIPWIMSDIKGVHSPSPPKRRRVSKAQETVDDNGILMLTSLRCSTPRSRNGSVQRPLSERRDSSPPFSLKN